MNNSGKRGKDKKLDSDKAAIDPAILFANNPANNHLASLSLPLAGNKEINNSAGATDLTVGLPKLDPSAKGQNVLELAQDKNTKDAGQVQGIVNPEGGLKALRKNSNGQSPDMSAPQLNRLSLVNSEHPSALSSESASNINSNLNPNQGLTGDFANLDNQQIMSQIAQDHHFGGVQSTKPQIKKGTGISYSGDDFVRTLDSIKNGPNRLDVKPIDPNQNLGTQLGSSLELKTVNEQDGKQKSKLLGMEHRLGTMAVANNFSGTNNSKSTIQLIAEPTQGAGGRDRLPSVNLKQMSEEINGIVQNHAGSGEMRLRLSPAHLGELSIRVITQGNHVALKIQASNEKAREIFQESISHLKESLSGHALVLGQVDLSLTNNPTHPSGSASDFNQSFSNSNFDGLNRDALMQDFQRQQGRNGQMNDQIYDVERQPNRNQIRGATSQPVPPLRNYSYSQDGHLDIRA